MDDKKLTSEQIRILKHKGTETPFTGKYYHFNEKGKYVCAACGNVLFDSDAKFDSGSGWPSFDNPENESAVKEVSDESHGMNRTEVVCSKCGGHLGHVFNDGPTNTGMRYCINSLSLDFKDKS